MNEVMNPINSFNKWFLKKLMPYTEKKQGEQ